MKVIALVRLENRRMNENKRRNNYELRIGRKIENKTKQKNGFANT